MIKKLSISLSLILFVVSANASIWECINRNVNMLHTCNTWRAPTPQGWVVSTDNGDSHISIAYVPDPNHEWKI